MGTFSLWKNGRNFVPSIWTKDAGNSISNHPSRMGMAPFRHVIHSLVWNATESTTIIPSMEGQVFYDKPLFTLANWLPLKIEKYNTKKKRKKETFKG